MILFVDDQPEQLTDYIAELSARSVEPRIVSRVSELDSYLANTNAKPDCIVLDVMFPGQNDLPGSLTSQGLTAGLPIFGGLRSRFPSTHIVVFTGSLDLQVKNFFRAQENCTLLYKGSVTPKQLANILIGLAEKRGRDLVNRLEACVPGKKNWREYETLVAEVFEFLFVPPLHSVLTQSRRSDDHEIRDLVLTNNADGFFWDQLRFEFEAKHIIVEIKNYREVIDKDELDQLRIYLRRKSIGRFGLLVSRLPPSESALISRRAAYSEDSALILCLSDVDLKEMIEMRERGLDPTKVLQRMKEQFELEY